MLFLVFPFWPSNKHVFMFSLFVYVFFEQNDTTPKISKASTLKSLQAVPPSNTFAIPHGCMLCSVWKDTCFLSNDWLLTEQFLNICLWVKTPHPGDLQKAFKEVVIPT